MTLTEKSKQSFEDWYADRSPSAHALLLVHFYNKREIEQYPWYIEWFDSVGIYIHIIPQTDCVGTAFYYTIKGYTNGEYYPKRQQAISAAITEANKIYNEKYK